ncbi:sensor histidine kinase [Luteibacter yeojuensis]|uniref:histidine kinase n=1 Tax=Luteibacter yeojuensis TaxID=345309 RepID=A0A7X5QVY9_9GAMM|nr:sensor histidine kinase [Luteibacter yeojuensis]NID16433.1 sensor histidine kinase [Luteibacter yeojuensis]
MSDNATSPMDDVMVLRDTARAQRVVIDDLNHRMKNMLMVVQAMARQSFRDDRPLDSSMDAFESRLRALASAHDLLLTRPVRHVAFLGVVESTIAPHDPGNARVNVSGPPLVLDAETAVAVAMALHELLTNASKYGALSTAAGTVTIAWSFVVGQAGGRVRLEWKERGGPPVKPPLRRGFGTRFIERTLAGEARGEAAIRFEPDGVRAVFEAPARRA